VRWFFPTKANHQVLRAFCDAWNRGIVFLLVRAGRFAELLFFRMAALGIESSSFCRFRNAGRFACFWGLRNRKDHQSKFFQTVLDVSWSSTVAMALDDKDAVLGDAVVVFSDHSTFDRVGERNRLRDRPVQHGFGVYFVYVLPARPG
jgi:hypothetical protein